MEKLCIFCQFCSWDPPSEYRYSTLTGGMEGGMSCGKHHFTEERPYDEDDFRKLILRGETCPDFAVIVLKPAKATK